MTCNYAPSDCFETFPLPPAFEIHRALEATGEAYYAHRAALMIVRNKGMTKTYNRFHDPAKPADGHPRLRDLHADMDRAVLRAYGWHDLAERAEPIFLDETNEDDHTYQGRLFWPSDFRDESSPASSPSTPSATPRRSAWHRAGKGKRARTKRRRGRQ